MKKCSECKWWIEKPNLVVIVTEPREGFCTWEIPLSVLDEHGNHHELRIPFWKHEFRKSLYPVKSEHTDCEGWKRK